MPDALYAGKHMPKLHCPIQLGKGSKMHGGQTDRHREADRQTPRDRQKHMQVDRKIVTIDINKYLKKYIREENNAVILN